MRLGRAARDFASSSGYEQMVTEPTHIDEGVLDLVLTDIPDVVEYRVESPVGPSGHGAVFMDVVLEQPVPHLVCSSPAASPQKNSVALGAGYRRCEGSQLEWNH